VQYSTSHVFERGLQTRRLHQQECGFSERADGKPDLRGPREWFRRAQASARLVPSRDAAGGIEPGDTVVVPLKVINRWRRWSQITQRSSTTLRRCNRCDAFLMGAILKCHERQWVRPE